eukprot:scaffold25478_cov101-Isochrysis_galbana.AAC.3
MSDRCSPVGVPAPSPPAKTLSCAATASSRSLSRMSCAAHAAPTDEKSTRVTTVSSTWRAPARPPPPAESPPASARSPPPSSASTQPGSSSIRSTISAL